MVPVVSAALKNLCGGVGNTRGRFVHICHPCSFGGPATHLVDCATTAKSSTVLSTYSAVTYAPFSYSTTLPKCCSSRGVLSVRLRQIGLPSAAEGLSCRRGFVGHGFSQFHHVLKGMLLRRIVANSETSQRWTAES